MARLSATNRGARRRRIYSPCTGPKARAQRGCEAHTDCGGRQRQFSSRPASAAGSAETEFNVPSDSRWSSEHGATMEEHCDGGAVRGCAELSDVGAPTSTTPIAHTKKGRKAELHDIQLRWLCTARFEQTGHPASERYIPLMG